MKNSFLERRKFLKNALNLLTGILVAIGVNFFPKVISAKEERKWKKYGQNIPVTYSISPELNEELKVDSGKLIGSIGSIVKSSVRTEDGTLETFVSDIEDDHFILFRRLFIITNGIKLIRSYAYHKIAYTEEASPNRSLVTFTPIGTNDHQRSIIGKWPTHTYSLEELTNLLESLWIWKTVRRSFEVNSEYPPESVTANFDRLLGGQRISGKVKDPITGKQFSHRYYLDNDGQRTSFVVETYPYRNGSKAVIYMWVPLAIKKDNHVISVEQVDEQTVNNLMSQITTIVND